MCLIVKEVLKEQCCHVDTLRDIASSARNNQILGNGKKLGNVSTGIDISLRQTYIGNVDEHE